MHSTLILSPIDDVHAAALYWAHRQAGLAPLWSKSASYADPALGGMSFLLQDAEAMELHGVLTPKQLRSVWYRRTEEPSSFPNARTCDLEFLRTQWRFFHRNVNAIAPGLSELFWVNNPESARMTENKLVQLRAARDCGLSVPDTLVSNDPEQIARFRKRHARVIYKPFAPHTWLDQHEDRGFIAHARLLADGVQVDERSLRLCPGIFQAFVDKVCDLRVTVIGEKMFVMQLDSIKGHAFIDWRSHVGETAFQAKASAIPEAYAEKLRHLMRTLGIVFGCIDLVLDRNNDLHFLEVNQGGQFLFGERWVASQPLLHAMAAMLAQARTDYSLDDFPAVSYQQFSASEAYQQWNAEVALHSSSLACNFVSVERLAA